MKQRVVLMVSVCLILADLLPVAADEIVAREKYSSGLKKLKNGDYEGAAVDFEASTYAFPNPNCLFNLALCYFELEWYWDSLQTFKLLENTFPEKLNDSDRASIQAKITDIMKMLPRLILKVTPNDAKVIVDGETMGRAPLTDPIILKAGEHSVEIQKEGYETSTLVLTLKNGIRRQETVTLKENQKPSEMPTSASPVVKERDVPAFGAENTRRKTTRLSEYNPVLLIVSIVGAGAMAAVSTELWSNAMNRKNDYTRKNDLLKESRVWDEDLEKRRDEDLRKSKVYNKAAVATTVITGAFGALTATELVLKITGKKRHSETVSLISGALVVEF